MTSKYLAYFFLFLLLIVGCKLQPSADLRKYGDYFSSAAISDQFTKNDISVTYFGTSTLLFDDGETQVLVDGFVSRPGVLKVALGNVKSNEKLVKAVLEKHQINRLAAVFVCHSHYDHVLDAPMVCKLTGAKLFGSSSTLMVGKGAGLSASQMSEYVPGKSVSFGNFQVDIIVSKHTPPFQVMGKSNATDPKHPAIEEPLPQPAKADKFIEGGTFDIYIRHRNLKILVKASTNYIEHGLDAYPADVLFLGTAMLGVMSDEFKEKYYQETVVSTGAKTLVPIHWDNFMRPLRKPFKALPRLVDDVESGFDFLIEKTKKDSVSLLMMGSEKKLYFR